MKPRTIAALILIGAMQPAVADAALVVKTLEFTGYLNAAVASTVTFSLHFDNSADLFNDFTDVTAVSGNLRTPLRISYSAYNDHLSLLGGWNGYAPPNGCGLGKESYCVSFTGISTSAPQATSFVYMDANGGIARGSDYSVRDVTPAPPTGSVPEPATWAMMLGGFGLVGSALRQRRRAPVRFG